MIVGFVELFIKIYKFICRMALMVCSAKSALGNVQITCKRPSILEQKQEKLFNRPNSCEFLRPPKLEVKKSEHPKLERELECELEYE